MRYTRYMTIISRTRLWLLVAVLFGGACALHPSFSLAMFDFPSLRIGLYQLATTGLVVVSLPPIWRQRHALLKNRWLLMSGLLITLASLIGLIFAGFSPRSLLYTGSLFALLVIGLSAALTFRELPAKFKRKLVTAGLWSGIIFGILAIGQLVIASFDASAFGTLCRGCAASVFGFPRINLLAAEPQFLASSLLPVFFLGLLLASERRLARWSLFFTSLAIALTFSRGAFIAIAGTGLIYLIWSRISRQKIALSWRSIGLGLLGALIGFALLLGSATLRYSNTPHITHNTAVSMIDQLSLGLIDLPPKTNPAPETLPTQTEEKPEPAPTANADFTPAGFVEASSNERLDAAKLALNAWTHNPGTVLFGVGLGNLGAFIQQHLNPAVPTDQTVYIMYILLLSNLGIVGLTALAGLALVALWRYYRQLAKPLSAAAFSLILATLLHFWFFGSLINSVHCFAWIGLLLYNYREIYAKKF